MQAILGSKLYGEVSINKDGEFIVPPELCKALNIKPGDWLIVLAVPDEKFIGFIPSSDFVEFLKRASEATSKASE